MARFTMKMFLKKKKKKWKEIFGGRSYFMKKTKRASINYFQHHEVNFKTIFLGKNQLEFGNLSTKLNLKL